MTAAHRRAALAARLEEIGAGLPASWLRAGDPAASVADSLRRADSGLSERERALSWFVERAAVAVELDALAATEAALAASARRDALMLVLNYGALARETLEGYIVRAAARERGWREALAALALVESASPSEAHEMLREAQETLAAKGPVWALVCAEAEAFEVAMIAQMPPRKTGKP